MIHGYLISYVYTPVVKDKNKNTKRRFDVPGHAQFSQDHPWTWDDTDGIVGALVEKLKAVEGSVSLTSVFAFPIEPDPVVAEPKALPAAASDEAADEPGEES